MPLSVDVNRGAIYIRPQAKGYWLLATGNRLLATGNRLLAADYKLLALANVLKPGNEET
jgi:hypothetical protein